MSRKCVNKQTTYRHQTHAAQCLQKLYLFGNFARAPTRASPDGDETRYVFMQSHFGHVVVAPFKKENIHGAEPADILGGEREAGRQTETETDRDRHTETETDRNRGKDRGRETDRNRQTETEKAALPTQFICDVSYSCMFH